MDTAIAVAVTVVPLALLLVLLVLSLRHRLQPSRGTPPMQRPGPPGGGGGRAGDRSPYRPRLPTLSGAAALDVPRYDESDRITG